MKTTMKSKRRSAALLSILCAGLVATFLGGCADTPYVAYGPGYYPAGYYTGYSGYYTRYSYDYDAYPYSYYYGPTYDRTVVRSGVRYNDAYGPRYYGSGVYGDWY
jgi:hypothetical protein